MNSISRAGVTIACILLFIGLAGKHFLVPADGSAPPYSIQLELLPQTIGEWQGKDLEGLGPTARETLRLDQYVRRAYTNPAGKTVILYIGYWQTQSGEHQAAKHSPLTCLPANGWKIFNPESKTVNLGSNNLTLNKLHASFNNNSTLFYYWFFAGNTTYTEEWQALLKISLGNYLNNRSDGGIVEVYTPLLDSSSASEAEALLGQFLELLYPELSSLVASAQPKSEQTTQ